MRVQIDLRYMREEGVGVMLLSGVGMMSFNFDVSVISLSSDMILNDYSITISSSGDT
jgi:hypothetical protein